jgi:hypothetical protein
MLNLPFLLGGAMTSTGGRPNSVHTARSTGNRGTLTGSMGSLYFIGLYYWYSFVSYPYVFAPPTKFRLEWC